MNDELDPKLQEFEAKLRRLKPYSVPPPSRPPRDWKRMIVYALATTTTAIAIVCMTSPQEPGGIQEPGVSAPGCVVFSKVPTIRGLTPPALEMLTPPALAPTMRQQLQLLLDEMEVAHPVAERKPEYSVVEIAIDYSSNEPGTESVLRRSPRITFDDPCCLPVHPGIVLRNSRKIPGS